MNLRILFRYILTELLIPFILALLVLSFVMMLTKLLNLADLLFEKEVPVTTVMGILYSLFLYLVGFTLPMAFLIGILISFGRLSRDSEIIALRASGIHVLSIAAPVALVGVLLFGLSYYLHVRILPLANWRSALQIQQLTQTGPENFLQEKVWLDGFGNSTLYIQVLEGDGYFRGVAITEAIEGFSIPRVIRAESGQYQYNPEKGEIRFDLQKGYIEEPSSPRGRDYVHIAFSTYQIQLPVTFKGYRKLQKKVYHMTSEELDDHLQRSAKGQIDYRTVLQEKYSRISMSFAVLVFFLIGFPLSIHLQNTEKTANLVLGAGLALAWYLLVLFGKRLSIGSQFPVWIATWLANFIMGGIGIYLTRKLLRT